MTEHLLKDTLTAALGRAATLQGGKFYKEFYRKPHKDNYHPILLHWLHDYTRKKPWLLSPSLALMYSGLEDAYRGPVGPSVCLEETQNPQHFAASEVRAV